MTDRRAQVRFICALEHVCGGHEKAASCFPSALAALYRADLLDEDAVLAWHDAPADYDPTDIKVAVAMRRAADPFVNWLRFAACGTRSGCCLHREITLFARAELLTKRAMKRAPSLKANGPSSERPEQSRAAPFKRKRCRTIRKVNRD